MQVEESIFCRVGVVGIMDVWWSWALLALAGVLGVAVVAGENVSLAICRQLPSPTPLPLAPLYLGWRPSAFCLLGSRPSLYISRSTTYYEIGVISDVDA